MWNNLAFSALIPAVPSEVTAKGKASRSQQHTSSLKKQRTFDSLKNKVKKEKWTLKYLMFYFHCNELKNEKKTTIVL